MHLKSLTLKGFKSFASATTLRLEPGITCVVGPNGSGKSNVVDALSWVMGEQGAKALRGGKMEDVIFAGTSGRPPLGRAEVTLTIDNGDGALPIEFSEVSITRRMFRDGASEYEINGSSCRLLDVQELLSDSGIGREMHVIVGQGRLADILQSRPEERRAFIEEAAGVLKHRKRKEKALRKLDAMAANLTRLTDLTAELRRQLKPLGRQAEIARRAATVQAELRDAKLRLAAADLVGLRAEIAKEQADEAAARALHAQAEAAATAAQREQAELETALAAVTPELSRAQDVWYRLSAIGERLRGTVRLAAERERHLIAPVTEGGTGRDPDQLDAEADEVAEREVELAEAVETARITLSDAQQTRADAEQAVTAAEQRHLAAVRAIADQREGLARLAGQVEALRSKTGATAEEIERLSAAAADARDRATAAQAEFEDLQGDLAAAESAEVGLDERHEAALAADRQAAARVDELVTAEREAATAIAHWSARVEALSLGLDRKDGTGLLLAQGDRLPGVLGSLAALLSVRPGAEAAVAAALGAVADAIAVADLAAAVGAVRLLRAEGAGRAGVLTGGDATTVVADRAGWPALSDGAGWAVDAVTVPERLRGPMTLVLDRVALVPDLAAAHALVTAHPSVRAVTPEGDVLGRVLSAGGSATAQSLIEVQAAVDEATDQRGAAQRRSQELAAALSGARAELTARKEDAENTLAALAESDAALNSLAEELARRGETARSAAAEAQRLLAQRATVEQGREEAVLRLQELETRLAAAQDDSEVAGDDPDTTERDAATATLSTARTEEVDARLALRTAEERARAVHGRSDQLRRAARAEREARSRAERARLVRERGARVAAAVAEAGRQGLAQLDRSLERAAAQRDQVAARRVDLEQRLSGMRTRVRELAGELETLTGAVHRDELLREQQRMRAEQLETRISEDFGIGLDDLISEYGPEVPVPPSAAELGEYEAAKERGEQVVAPPSVPFDRPTQQRRAQRAERDLATLGKVNPLALEEFAALEERYKFLSTQLEDLKDTRRDLLMVIKEVDDKILELFASAYHDVAAQFGAVFATLFPGGEGKLVLTEPDDMLTTGIEVEARPPGKKVKRLSLLSGGEKSLTAVAMLVAIFKARPSPFYVMDEVEAALDETNLRRLITLFEQLREKSQLIVITHQKATMEVADALYGVSMRGDGITTVISQRLRGAGATPPALRPPPPGLAPPEAGNGVAPPEPAAEPDPDKPSDLAQPAR
jgi:chromosome segregation protein